MTKEQKEELIKILQSEEITSDEVIKSIEDWVELRKLMRNEVRTNKKAVCPLCNHKTTKYTRSLNKGMYFFLMHLSSKWHKGEWVHYETVKSQVNGKFQCNATDYSKLLAFGLLESNDERDEETGLTDGRCRITDDGWNFLRGKHSIPKHYYFVNNKIVRESKEKIFFNDCQQKFKMSDLKAGN